MKSVAELIAELQKIPNPEKVGIAIFVEDDWALLHRDTDMTVLVSPEILNYPEEAVKAGFEKIIQF